MPHLWFTADKHHSHKNILKFENRPFKSVEEMDIKLVKFHNEMVKADDLTIDCGDFVFKGGIQAGKKPSEYFLNQYNGRYFIFRGNHDAKNSVLDPFQKGIMVKSGIKALCLHDPINANTACDIVIHGHLHSKHFLSELHEKNKTVLLINVGVDCWKMRPVQWSRIVELYTQWKAGKFKVPVYDKQAVLKHRELRKKNRSTSEFRSC